MALWSLFVQVGSKGYSTQVSAPTARKAIDVFLEKKSLPDYLKSLSADGWPSSFSKQDVILFTSMDCLINMYLCQLGRRGKYITITMARTVPGRKAPHRRDDTRG